MNLIDIHAHLINNVDDGSTSLDESLKYLDEAKKYGIKVIICTPHMCKGKREKALKIVNNFKILRMEALKRGIDLYLGNEIMYQDNTLELLNNKKITSLKQSKYVLVEFKRNERRTIEEIIELLDSFIDNGYVPILAHPELYINYRNIEDIKLLKEAGILLQMDSTSIIKSKVSNLRLRKFSKKLLNERLIDFVASDSHCTKERNFKSLKKAYKVVSKIDKEYADIIFCENALDIIK